MLTDDPVVRSVPRRWPKRALQLLLAISLSVWALSVAFQGVSLEVLLLALRQVDYVWALPSLALFYSTFFLRGLRWRQLFLPHHHVPLGQATGAVLVCFAVNNLFPGRVGELARAYLVGKRRRLSFATALGTVVAERFLDAATLLLCLVGIVAFAPFGEGARFERTVFGRHVLMTDEVFAQIRNRVLLLFLVLLLAVVGLSVPFCRDRCLAALRGAMFVPKGVRTRIEAAMARFSEGLSFFQSIRTTLALLAATLAIGAVGALSIQALARGFPFEREMTFIQAFALNVIVCVFIALPAAPGYWGFFEAGTVFSLGVMGIHAEESLAVSFAIVLHLCQWLPVIPIALVWLLLSRSRTGEDGQARA